MLNFLSVISKVDYMKYLNSLLQLLQQKKKKNWQTSILSRSVAFSDERASTWREKHKPGITLKFCLNITAEIFKKNSGNAIL